MTFATRLRARNDAPGKHQPIPCNQQGGLHRMVTREGRRQEREPLTRNMGGDPEPDKPVHEPATDSRTGEDETWDSPQLAAPRHRSGLDEGGLPADPQGWCPGHRWGESGRLRGDPGGQSLGPPGAHQVGPLPRPTGAPGLYSESGWHATASGYPDIPRHSKTKWHSVPWYWRQYTSRISSPARMASDQAARPIKRWMLSEQPSWVKEYDGVSMLILRNISTRLTMAISGNSSTDESRTALSDG